MIRLARLACVSGLLTAGVVTAHAAETPDTENGRYAFSPSADGVLRLDTRDGAVSTCKTNGEGWACYATPDERAAFDAEIGRLQAETDRLRARLGERGPDKSAEALPKSDPLAPRADGERKIEIPLPSDRDMDRVMSFVESAWKRLIELAARMQRDAGRI